MSARKVKAARRPERAAAPTPPPRRLPPIGRSSRSGLVAVAVVAVLAGSFVLPDVFDSTSVPSSGLAADRATEPGTGLPPGSPVPVFDEKDVESGVAITSESVYRSKTLLFFSEGVMCQACFEQIKGLEQFGAELDRRGIQLISITPDSPRDLRRAASAYGIATPMISDDNRDMSTAFNTLGLGMHGDAPGHAFVLVDHGKVVWYRDYWLAPTRSMYVEPGELLADIPTSEGVSS